MSSSLLLMLVLTVVVAAVPGFLVPRAVVLVPVVLAWPVYYLGLDRDWWGEGLGDGWAVPAISLTVAAAVGGIVGILAGTPRQMP